MRLRVLVLLPILLWVLLLVPSTVPRAAGDPSDRMPLRIYAAASLTEAMDDIATEWQRQGHPRPLLVIGGSAALARQIEAGAPADVYAAADPRWMEHLVRGGRIDAATRDDLLGNALVLVAPRGTGKPLVLRQGADIARRFPGRICIGDPEAVPAGRHARAALHWLGAWNSLQGRLVYADDVRGALAFIERGECAAGLVYATDARITPRVEVLARVPAQAHGAIVYPFVATQRAQPAARDFLRFLRSAPAAAVFRRHGFVVRQ